MGRGGIPIFVWPQKKKMQTTEYGQMKMRLSSCQTFSILSAHLIIKTSHRVIGHQECDCDASVASIWTAPLFIASDSDTVLAHRCLHRRCGLSPFFSIFIYEMKCHMVATNVIFISILWKETKKRRAHSAHHVWRIHYDEMRPTAIMLNRPSTLCVLSIRDDDALSCPWKREHWTPNQFQQIKWTKW